MRSYIVQLDNIFTATIFQSMPKYTLPVDSPSSLMYHHVRAGGSGPLGRRFSHHSMPMGGARSADFLPGNDGGSGRTTPSGGSLHDDLNSSEEEGQLARRRIRCVSRPPENASDESGPSSLQSTRSSRYEQYACDGLFSDSATAVSCILKRWNQASRWPICVVHLINLSSSR